MRRVIDGLVFLLAFFISVANHSFALGVVTVLFLIFRLRHSWLKPFTSLLNNFSKKGTHFLEWLIAIFLAVLIVKNVFFFLFELYTIPSNSMEPNLSRGDVVVVNKVGIGNRCLECCVNFYFRLLPFSSIQRGDVIVFNFPEGDSIFVQSNKSNYRYIYRYAGREVVAEQKLKFQSVFERERFLKRVVGLPGDTLAFRDGDVLINNKIKDSAYETIRMVKFDSIQDKRLLQSLPILGLRYQGGFGYADLNSDVIKANRLVCYSIPASLPDRLVFPFETTLYSFNSDNLGPFVVPKRGEVINLNTYSFALYRRIIEVYEENSVVEKNGRFFVNGEEVRSYRFKQNYFWVVGDNRGHSFDSRYWGFVPENHIVGTASRILFSKGNTKSTFAFPDFKRSFKSIN